MKCKHKMKEQKQERNGLANCSEIGRYQLDFLSKELFETTFWKEQWPTPFVDHPIHGILSAKSQQKWNF